MLLRSEVPNHWDASRYLDLKRVQVGPEKLPNWYIYHSFDVTRDQKNTENMTPGLETQKVGNHWLRLRSHHGRFPIRA